MSNKQVQTKNTGWSWLTVTAVAIIFFGVVELIKNYTTITLPFELFNNWWAVLILIPSLYVLFNAWQVAQASNGFSPRAVGLVIGGICMLLLVPIFVFSLDWAKVWPLFVIISGLGMVVITLIARK